jgi:hypothetical protein
MNVKGDPETPSEQRTGQHFRNFAAPVALPIARKPVGKAKRYKVTLQRLMKFTTEVDAENQREVLEIALQAVNQKGFQRQVFSQPRSKSIHFQGPIGEEWQAISAVIEPDTGR